MKFAGIFLIFCSGIIFEQQGIGLCLQRLYCTDQDPTAAAGLNPVSSQIRIGKAGPRGRKGPPGKVNYDVINETIEEYFQELTNEMRTKLSTMEAMLIDKDQEIRQLKSELTNEMRTKLSTMEAMLIDKDQEIRQIKSDMGELQNKIQKPFNWYKASNNNYYRVFNDTVNYEIAKLNCLVHGAKLASVGIRDPTVFSELVSVIKSSGGHNTWIGLDEIQTNGRFMWSDGVAAETGNTPWETGQPNNYGGDQDCVELRLASGYKLNDEDCSFNNKYLCEIKL